MTSPTPATTARTSTGRVLDRVARFDDRSRGYAAEQLLTTAPTTLRSYTWDCPVHLDQGREGACVGNGFAHHLAAAPAEVPGVTEQLAVALYDEAKKLDDTPGEDYSGTSVLAGAKATTKAGYLTSYRWAFSLDEALAVLAWHGPIVIGVNWYSGMEDVDAKGLLHARGRVVGGHCIAVTGVAAQSKLVRLHNSWGPDWGVGGDAFLSFTDLAKLLKADGEVCVPVKKGAAAA